MLSIEWYINTKSPYPYRRSDPNEGNPEAGRSSGKSSVVASETESISVVEVRISGIGIIPVVAREIIPVVARETVSISIVSGIGIDQPRGEEYH